MDDIRDPELSVKVKGYQWYRSYEDSDYVESGVSIAFDSFMVSESNLELGD